MNKKSQIRATDESTKDPEIWKVEPGFAMGIFHLGMPKHELLETLKEKKLDAESIAGGNAVYVLDMDTKLYFGDESPYHLDLIEVSDERARFGTLKIMWQFPHNLFASVSSGSTMWFDELSLINRTLPQSKSPGTPTDDQLLNGGVLWMKDLGVGFQLTRGKITTLYLCDPARLPPSGYGEFTGSQRHLSERMQLASFKTPTVTTPPTERAFKIGLMLTAILAIAFFGWNAWEEKKRWDNAPEAQAEVVSVWPAPPEPFPSIIHVSYQDQQGKTHEIELAVNDFYSTPQVGDKVALRYLPESPEKALSPIKFRDVGFDQFVPYLMGTIGVYSLLHLASGFAFSRGIGVSPVT